MERRLVVSLFVLMLWLAACTAAQTPAASPLTLEDAIARAMAANPAIVAARLQRPVHVAGVQVAGERPNPEITYEAAKETPRQAIGAALPIELGGKRQRRIEVAQAAVATGEAGLARVIAEVRNDVRRTYFEIIAADRQVTIADDIRALAARARDAARARVDVGDVPRSDLVQSELAVASAENELTAARGEAAATRAELNALLGQPPSTPLTPSESLNAGSLPSIDAATAQAAQTNAELQVLDRQIAEQTAKRNLAQALRKPDLTAGGTFTYDAEPEFRFGWRANFGVTLPVFTTHRAGVFVEEAELARLKAERGAQAARINGAIAAALTRAASARAQMTRYETDILPLALQSEDMAQVAYTAGQISLSALIQAVQTARETRQRGLQASLEYQRALADLERAIGTGAR